MSLCATLSGYRVSPGTRVPPASADRVRTRYKPLGRIESTDLYSPNGRGISSVSVAYRLPSVDPGRLATVTESARPTARGRLIMPARQVDHANTGKVFQVSGCRNPGSGVRL